MKINEKENEEYERRKKRTQTKHSFVDAFVVLFRISVCFRWCCCRCCCCCLLLMWLFYFHSHKKLFKCALVQWGRFSLLLVWQSETWNHCTGNQAFTANIAIQPEYLMIVCVICFVVITFFFSSLIRISIYSTAMCSVYMFHSYSARALNS